MNPYIHFRKMKSYIKILCLTVLVSGCISKNEIDLLPTYELRITTIYNEDGVDSLKKDQYGYYHLQLNKKSHQTIRKVKGVLSINGHSPTHSEKIEWDTNLFWWVLRGDTLVQVTKLYINKLTGELQYINYPPIISQIDVMVPTVNCCSYTSPNGEISTIIAPVSSMIGDTLILKANTTSVESVHTSVKIILE